MRAIFVDGASLFNMGIILEIARFNYSELRKLLSEIGNNSAPLYGQPIITLNPGIAKSSAGKAYRTAGFEVIAVETSNGTDDKALIERISALKSEVTEVVMVSTDQDYAPILREKVVAGIKVYWVATKQIDSKGTLCIGAELENLFNSEFKFIELKDHKNRITSALMSAPTKVQTRSFKLELTGALSHDEYHKIHTLVLRLLRENPALKYKIEG